MSEERQPAPPRRRGRLERIVGGSPAMVALRLALASLLVGIVMSVLGIEPGDILRWIERRIAWLTDMSFETLRAAFSYFLLGAAVVVPVWIVWRIVRLTRD
mgnify:CR=1 FL=1